MTPIPFNEAQRLEALASYQVLDSAPEPAFDSLTRLAARHFGAPIALVSLLDEGRQWFMSRVGIDTSETPRGVAFCAHAIMDDAVMVVPDATEDARFTANPLVTGPLGLRFYAGAPLITRSGFRLGTVCLLDRVPRSDFGAEPQAALADFAGLAMVALEARRDRHELRRLEDRGQRTADAQHEVLAYLAHEIRTPLSAIVGFAEVIQQRALGGEISARYRDYAAKIREAGLHLVDVAGKTLNLQRLKTGDLALEEHQVGIQRLFSMALATVQILSEEAGVVLTCREPPEDAVLQLDPTLTTQMLVNLLTNAIKYTPTGGAVTLSVSPGPDGAVDLSVADSGIGMDEKGLARALLPFGRLAVDPGRPADGYGLGLPMTKQLVELHGGQLLVASAAGQGTRASLRFPAYRLVAGSLGPEVASPSLPEGRHVA